jgi:ubiquitin C-terminal hydrolase
MYLFIYFLRFFMFVFAKKFVEDLSEGEKAEAGHTLPPGLANLGNTCYMNRFVFLSV